MYLLMDTWGLLMQVSPFRYLRINGYLHLPEAFRSLSRLSSAPSAKAFPLCSYLLDLFAKLSFKLFRNVVAILHFLFGIFLSSIILSRFNWLFYFSLFSFQGTVINIMLVYFFKRLFPFKWRLRDSNSWPPACKAGALPTELNPHIIFFFTTFFSKSGLKWTRTTDLALIRRAL